MMYEYEVLRGMCYRNRQYGRIAVVPANAVIPTSPYTLIQEMVVTPWEGVVGAILQQRTQRAQAHPATWAVLRKWPTPEAMMRANRKELANVIRHCGFQNRRAMAIMTMSIQWTGGLRPPYLFGCGQYVYDSYRIFALNEVDLEVDDVELRRYLKWRGMTHAKDHSRTSDLRQEGREDHPSSRRRRQDTLREEHHEDLAGGARATTGRPLPAMRPEGTAV